ADETREQFGDLRPFRVQVQVGDEEGGHPAIVEPTHGRLLRSGSAALSDSRRLRVWGSEGRAIPAHVHARQAPMNTSTTIVRRRLPALAVCAAFSWLATPAWAADAACLDENGLPTAADTNQGIENPAEGENTTRDPRASAWGGRNNQR